MPVTLPPPHTGMTIATEAFLKAIEPMVDIDVIPIQVSGQGSKLPRKVRKAYFAINACIRMLLRRYGYTTNQYQVANSGYGLAFNIVFSAIARMRGWKCVVHHQVYSYITEYSWAMKVLDEVMGAEGIHILLCEKMRSDFLSMYSPKAKTFIVNNSHAVFPNARIRQIKRERNRLRLGHISNLSIEKGLDLVLEVYAECQRALPGLELVIAGPTTDKRSKKLIQRYHAMNLPGFSYLGPVHGSEKVDYYDGIDLLLFPTRYKNEAQPVVILEAMACGVSPIAIDRGCIRGLIGTGGYTIESEVEWMPQVVKIIRNLLSSPEEFSKMSTNAQNRFKELKETSGLEISHFINHLGCI